MISIFGLRKLETYRSKRFVDIVNRLVWRTDWRTDRQKCR